MSLKRPRIHQCGFTNLDFRTKGDFESLKLYEPWQIPKEFGTMGKSFYYPSYSDAKKIFSVSKSLNKLKNIVHGSPDPKAYPGCLYYKKNNIKPNIIQEFRAERVAELDESEIGKDKYIGDSMMIADINKYRQKRKIKKSDLKDSKSGKQDFVLRMEKAKELKNKEATQETQLVKIKAKETLDNKINAELYNSILYIRFKDNSYIKSNYSLEYSIIVTESNYEENEKYPINIIDINGKEGEEEFNNNKKEYIGKTIYYNIVLSENLSENCSNSNCTLCRENSYGCLTFKSD